MALVLSENNRSQGPVITASEMVRRLAGPGCDYVEHTGKECLKSWFSNTKRIVD
jgi:hypothetical protein